MASRKQKRSAGKQAFEPTTTTALRSTGLKVFQCPDCGAPLPLPPGKEDTVVCPFCGVSSPLPPEYAALRDAERTRATERTDAERLYRTLGRPPGAFLRILAKIPLLFLYLFTAPLVLTFIGLALPSKMASIGRAFGVNSADMITNGQYLQITAGTTFLVLGLPLILAAYGHRRTDARRGLMAALAALPPDRKGGPARCHACGAPLSVPDGATGVACPYCGADNLVAVPEEWVGQVRSRVRALVTSIEEADKENRQNRSQMLRRLTGEALALLVCLVLPFCLIGYGTDHQNGGNTWPPRWKEFVGTSMPRLLIHQPVPIDRDDYLWSAEELLNINGPARRTAFEDVECKADTGCRRTYLVALRRGETLTLQTDALPSSVPKLAVTFACRRDGLFDDWETLQRNATPGLAPDHPVSFHAPLGAWYRINLSESTVAHRTGAFSLSAHLEDSDTHSM